MLTGVPRFLDNSIKNDSPEQKERIFLKIFYYKMHFCPVEYFECKQYKIFYGENAFINIKTEPFICKFITHTSIYNTK